MGRLTASVPRTRLFTDPYFGAAAIPLRSGLRVCLPPGSFLPQQVLSAGQLRLLRPSRTCIVTFARIGYAIRPTTGNWRNEDFHLARFTALSTAPLNRGVHPICAVPNFVPSGGLDTFSSLARAERQTRINTGESHFVQMSLNC